MKTLAVGNGRVDIQLGLYPAAILHPSLGCPLLVDNPKQVSLFIVASYSFRQAFLRGNGHDGKVEAIAGDNIRLVINQHLKIHAWEESNEKKKNLVELDQTLFGGAYAKKINCFYLGKLGEELRDRHGRHFANLRSSTKSQFSAVQLDEVFQIELSNWPFQPETLYDTFWAVRNSDPTTTDHNEKFLDMRDRMVRQFVGKTWQQGRGAQNDSKAVANGPLFAFKVDSKEGVTFKPDPSVPLQSRHPIYVPAPGKKQLNIGHLSDVHLSSRQHAYKGKLATVIPHADQNTSKHIGEMVNNNADNLYDLLNQFADDPHVDVLVITGDLYDHIHNFDPTSRPTPTTGKLWEAMYLDSVKAVKERAKEYPYGIDSLAVYSLLVHFYTHSKKKKPVLLISGNHEAYEYPYGISPRLQELVKVNDGIPLDHNLTIYEAILLYGPGYHKVLKSFNFSENNYDWFSTVFSPLADFALNYKNQCFVGVEWGDGESFVRSAARGSGTLPRATKSLSGRQRALIDSALAQGKESIFCSHFTVVNYNLSKPLAQKGVINVGKSIMSDFDHGSSEGDRTSIYERFLNHPKLKLSLAGHSHRVGLYACDHLKKTVYPASSEGMGFSGYSTQPVEYVLQVQTHGYHPENPATKNVSWNNRTRVFVTASVGPIPKQNHLGEMCGQGMEYPSAGKVVFNGNEPEISLLKSRKSAAKPRFSVACDYIDIMEGGFWESFNGIGKDGEFELKIYWEKIHPGFAKDQKDPRFSASTKTKFVENVTLWLVGSGETTEVSMSSKKLHGDALRFSFASDLRSQIEFFGQSLGAMFVSFKFSQSALVDVPGFIDYDYESPWNIQIGIYDSKGREVQDRPENHKPSLDSPLGNYINKIRHSPDNDLSKWKILRHKKYGEVPYFRWRSQTLSNEYAYNLNKRKT